MVTRANTEYRDQHAAKRPDRLYYWLVERLHKLGPTAPFLECVGPPKSPWSSPARRTRSWTCRLPIACNAPPQVIEESDFRCMNTWSRLAECWPAHGGDHAHLVSCFARASDGSGVAAGGAQGPGLLTTQIYRAKRLKWIEVVAVNRPGFCEQRMYPHLLHFRQNDTHNDRWIFRDTQEAFLLLQSVPGSNQNTMAKQFQKLEILGLHGDRDLVMHFGTEATILTAENGSGKTTVLNTLYAILSGKYHKLRGLTFDKIILYPQRGNRLEITSKDALSCLPILGTNGAKHLLSKGAPPELIQEAVELLRHRREIMRHTRPFRQLASFISGGPSFLQDVLMDIAHESSASKPAKALKDIDSWRLQNFPFEVLYFPTYRRVEEELHQLGYEHQEFRTDEKLIHFGMDDVKERFNSATIELKEKASEWYGRISGKMLSELIGGISVGQAEYEQLKNKQALGIVLERVGDGISAPDKERILSLVETEDAIREDKYNALVYFLSNLVQIYDQQKDIDARIKEFSEVVNKYLIDKSIVYDEKKVQIDVLDKISQRPVDLGNLSSGEKQTASLFSRLYLTKGAKYAILFDEPELSLSMEWQKTLLPDIINSKRCGFLVAATHSPFIFANELDRDARSLSVRRTESQR